MPTPLSAPLRWFRRVLWLGIIGNLALAIPTFIAPATIMALNHLPPATPIMWPRFAAMLIILLSAFYAPAGVDPIRYRAVAWLSILSRLVGVIFFVGFQPAAYHVMGYFDLVFFVPELVLLIMGTRAMDRAPGSLGSTFA
jgi:hypothetical protein